MKFTATKRWKGLYIRVRGRREREPSVRHSGGGGGGGHSVDREGLGVSEGKRQIACLLAFSTC